MGVIKGFSDPAAELYDAVYRELASLRRASGIESHTFSQTLADDLQAVQRIAGSSVHEIDRVAGELQTIREAKHERVQRDSTNSDPLPECSVGIIKVGS
jgi:hypothetical protein